MKKYRLIDDPLCDVNEDIPCRVNCQNCEYFFDCMEDTEEDIDDAEIAMRESLGSNWW